MAGVWRPPLKVVWCGTVPYQLAWDWQRQLAAARADGELEEDVLLLLEHPPVYTMGRGGQPEHLLQGEEGLRSRGAEYFEVDRGGSVTYHGPGQLVGYPIVNLDQLGIDAIAYLRGLEEALIDACQMRGVEAFREPPYTGVWNRDGKLAALGVKLSGRKVTYHGFSLNGTTDLSAFELIVPCGIEGRRATSLQAAGATGDLRPEALAELVSPFVAHALGLRWEQGEASELGLNLAISASAPTTGAGRSRA
ncbi:MAG TPA: lipoyl(octanoyl) transferase LipB [Candidatus Dormibacteraeota bacterium]|nr:lipoyl(octanoyl) transferase LipB [Candidatus Dormibacteraeota bacterium]